MYKTNVPGQSIHSLPSISKPSTKKVLPHRALDSFLVHARLFSTIHEKTLLRKNAKNADKNDCPLLMRKLCCRISKTWGIIREKTPWEWRISTVHMRDHLLGSQGLLLKHLDLGLVLLRQFRGSLHLSTDARVHEFADRKGRRSVRHRQTRAGKWENCGYLNSINRRLCVCVVFFCLESLKWEGGEGRRRASNFMPPRFDVDVDTSPNTLPDRSTEWHSNDWSRKVRRRWRFGFTPFAGPLWGIHGSLFWEEIIIFLF